jgi:3-oxoadipate enol-lactonase
VSVALHHEIAGPQDAPVLLLAGALGTSLDVWDALVEPLAERLRVVRVDHRGHGRSPVPPGPYEIADLAGDVLALLDDLGVQRAHLAGVSIGAMVAMWLGAHAPERVDRLVLICTSAHMAPASRWAERAAAVLNAGSVEAVADTVVERWLTPPFAAEHPQVRAWLRAMLAAQPADGYAACCGAIERMDLRGDLPRITAPTLVVSGADDDATGPEHQELIAAAIPGARLVSLAGAAHQAAVEQPAATTRLILEHLEASP